jgi:hypothetical protein
VEKTSHSALRVTQWTKDGKTHSLLMNLSAQPVEIPIARRTLNLAGGEIVAIADPSGACEVVHRFATASVRPNREDPPAPLRFGSWRVRFAGEEWREIDFPKAVYQLRPLLSKSAPRLRMELTGYAQPDGEPVAEWVEYQTTLNSNGSSSGAGAKLVLAPTAVRGEVVITVAGREQASLKIFDTDTREREVDLSAVASGGETPVVFRFNRPMALDGFKLLPKIRR